MMMALYNQVIVLMTKRYTFEDGDLFLICRQAVNILGKTLNIIGALFIYFVLLTADLQAKGF